MILLKIFLFLLGLLVLLLLLIFVPKTWLAINCRFTDDAKTGRARVQLAGKLIGILVRIDWPDVNVKGGIGGVYFPIWSKKSSEETAGKKESKPKKSEKSKARKQAKHSTGDWIVFGKTVIERFSKLPQIEKFGADLVVGLGNPAGTGLMMGTYYAIKPTLNVLQSVQITPDFINKKINGETEFIGSIRLIKTIPLIIFIVRFLWKK